MKLLILGGTRFLGRHLSTTALASSHEVTLFHRGQHPYDSAAVESIRGDRNSDLSKLQGRRWDAVIDTCGMLPGNVKAAAEALSESVDHYTFISTQNVYADVSLPGVDESARLAMLRAEQLDQANAIDTSGEPSYGKLYGGLKALCEQAAEVVMPGRVLNVRPGLIVGPYDYTDRFTYWVVRVARGGEVMVPDRPDRFVRFIDVRDLADWIVRMIEHKETGAYNANGPSGTFTMKNVLDECKAMSESDATFTWASESFLLQENVAAWSDLPLWLPEEAASHLKGFMFVSSEKAEHTGLSCRALRHTIKDTLAWHQAEPRPELKAGLPPEREQMLLRKWHEQHDLHQLQ